MMTLRAFDARMQMAQRQGKTSFYMQHMGEEAVSCAFRKALEPGDMNFPTYRQAGLLIAGGYPHARDDVPDLFQRARSDEGPAAAGDVLLARARLLLDLGQPRDAVHPGGRLGDGLGDQGRHPDRRRLDRRRLDRRIGLPCRAGLRLDLQGAGRAEHRQQPVGDLDLPGHRPRRLGHLRRARPGLRHPGAARRRQRLSSRSMPWRNGRSSGRAAISGRRWSST